MKSFSTYLGIFFNKFIEILKILICFFFYVFKTDINFFLFTNFINNNLSLNNYARKS